MTPRDILTASQRQVRMWVALLEGWRWHLIDYGDPEMMGGPTWEIRQPALSDDPRLMRVTSATPELTENDEGYDRHLPEFTYSLDVIWPVQAKTDEVQFMAALEWIRSGVVSLDTYIKLWGHSSHRPSSENCKWMIKACADARARAICLCRIEELRGLVRGES